MSLMPPQPSDSSWLRACFLLPENAISVEEEELRNRSSVFDKMHDASLGGNRAINAPPMFTPSADPKSLGIMTPSNSSRLSHREIAAGNEGGWGGMGRYYSEAIDDNTQLLNLRFGVPEHNSLMGFFSSCYSDDLGRMARTGETSGLLNKVAGALGTVLAVPLLPFVLLIRGVLLIGKKPRQSKFYYVKVTMPLYWAAVNNIVSQMAIDLGLMPDAGWNEEDDPDILKADGTPNYQAKNKVSRAVLEKYHNALPEIFKSDGGIDVKAIATRAERLVRVRHKDLMKQLDQVTDLAAAERLYTLSKNYYTPKVQPSQFKSLNETLDYWSLTAGHETTPATEVAGQGWEILSSFGQWLTDKLSGSFLKAEALDGSGWVSFRVNGERSFTDSFTNSVGESALAGKINGMSQQARETQFSLGGGNLGEGLLAEFAELGISFGTKVFKEFAETIGLGGLGALVGGGYIEIPKVWENASCDLPKIEYTLQLRATYGNKMSIFTDIYVPLAMLLAGVLPMNTGQSSYTAPFMVEAFRRGRNVCRMGIIDSLSVQRGVGNNGWSTDGLPTAVDVNLSIADLGAVLSMPIERPALFTGFFDDHTTYSDYIGVLGGLDLIDMTTLGRRFKRNLAVKATAWNSMFTLSNMASVFANQNIIVDGLSLKNIISGTYRLFGGASTTRY